MAKRVRALPPEGQLLTRDDFKRFVFLRADGKCVFCDKPAEDPHHVLERKLYPDGGFYLGNGAAICHEHHWDCETTKLTVDQVRSAVGIANPVLPPGFCPHIDYDKWGNRTFPSGVRVWGPLQHDEGAKRALALGGLLGQMMPQSAHGLDPATL